MASTEQQDPSSVAEAKSRPDKAKWEKAMEEKWNHFIQITSGS